jgi:hypothetical protein
MASLLAAASIAPARAEADEARAVFALLVGVNRSVDADQAPLHYADDDAALYFTLFRTLGARTYLVTRPDDNTRRVHAQAVAESVPPTLNAFEQAVRALVADVALAHAQHVKTTLYFVYAGHGSVHDGRGYIALEDGRLSGKDIARIFDRVAADEVHLIVDACYSFYLAYDRGAGGHARPFPGLRGLGALAERQGIGLLLSTSSARESHEWEGIQAGVFSHEVRSGLLGAADADGDGQVSYREIAAFVERANSAIPNERFRPEVYARAPRSTDQLLDLRPAMARHVELPPGHHYVLESGEGLRLADVHDALGRAARLLRPMLLSRLYVRTVAESEPDGEAKEYLLPQADDVVDLASIAPQPMQARERGAAHEAFSTIFSMPFDAGAVTDFRFRPLPDDSAFDRLERRRRARRIAGWTTAATAAGSLLGAIGLSVSAARLHAESIAGDSQREVASRNQSMSQQGLGADVLYGTAGALALTSALLLLVPQRLPVRLAAGASADGAAVMMSGHF